MSRRALAVGTALGAAGLALALGACGRKALPKPPELVAPRPVARLALTTAPEGVRVEWSRPTEYVDGTTMEDLGGFVVERNRNNSSFAEIARVEVTDRGRFQKRRRFTYLDRAVASDVTYHYRIVAFTTDGYYSAPSGAAAITWTPPSASPSPAPSPPAPRQP